MSSDEVRARKKWIRVLARTDSAALKEAIDSVGGARNADTLKPAEIGTVMIEGRAGGEGRRFNLGEAAVTRCVVRVGDAIGVSYALGRDRQRARLAAIADALMQDATLRPQLEERLIAPAERAQQAAREKASRKAAATKVEFFTLVRGDG